jgi:hypothetical protein
LAQYLLAMAGIYAGVGLALKRRTVPQAAAALAHHSDRGGECVIESSGFGGRNSPADCRCRMTGNTKSGQSEARTLAGFLSVSWGLVGWRCLELGADFPS